MIQSLENTSIKLTIVEIQFIHIIKCETENKKIGK